MLLKMALDVRETEKQYSTVGSKYRSQPCCSVLANISESCTSKTFKNVTDCRRRPHWNIENTRSNDFPYSIFQSATDISCDTKHQRCRPRCPGISHDDRDKQHTISPSLALESQTLTSFPIHFTPPRSDPEKGCQVLASV